MPGDKKPSYIDFDHDKFRDRLAAGYTTAGEIGVLSYKFSKKIHPLWKFKNPEVAKISSDAINQKYTYYADLVLKNAQSAPTRAFYYFIRADICRKFILMGYTRAMRYYYHSTGVKWGKRNGKWVELPCDYDPEKKQSADIFFAQHSKIIKSAKYKKILRLYNEIKPGVDFDSDRV